MAKRRFTDDEESEFGRAYLAGASTVDLARRHQTTPTVIQNALRRQGVPRRVGRPPSVWTGADDQVAEAVNLYRAGSSVRAVAKRFSCRASVIADLLREHGLSVHRGREKIAPDRRDQLLARYKAGATIRALTVEFGMSRSGVSGVLRRAEASREKWSRWTPERRQRLLDMHQAGLSASEIARRVGVSQNSISIRLRQLGVPPQPTRSGAKHGGWRGGRHVVAGGYIQVRPTADDLAYCKPNASGYVLEHRLVMGRIIGRPLLASETVHHINGRRADNSPENLQLRQGKHGTGVIMTCNACGSHDVVARRIT